MMRRCPIIIPAASMLHPFEQGQVSSLCGLYSILNAAQLALWPDHRLTKGQLKKVFVAGVEYLDNAGILAEVMRCGIDEKRWLQLSNIILKKSSIVAGLKLRRHFFLRDMGRTTSRSTITAIRRQLRAGNHVVLMLWGAYNHATILVGYDGAKLLLFDSSGLQWITENSLGLYSPSSTKRHQITQLTTFTISKILHRKPWS